MLCDDIIIWAAIEALVKGEIDFTQTALVCLEQNSLSRYCQVSFRLPTMAFYDVQNFPQGFPRETFKCFMYKEELQCLWQSVRLHHLRSTNCYIKYVTNY